MRSVDKAVKRGLAHRARRDTDNPQIININTTFTTNATSNSSYKVISSGVRNLTANIANVTAFLN